MQLHAAQQLNAEKTRKGRQSKNTTPEMSDTHAIKIRMGIDGFSLDVESGNSLFIFAILLTSIIGLIGIILIFKIF